MTKRPDYALLTAIQTRTARVSIGASTVRGQGAGVVEPAREFLARLDIARFGTPDEGAFSRRLNAATLALERRLPPRSATWGLSRKLLNVFLRDCLYSAYLQRDLAAAEKFLELPLDSITTKELTRHVEGLPEWPGVKHLTPDRSAVYQAAASECARRKGIPRVHLDTYWWGART